MKTRYTIKNPGRGTGYRMPLINDDLRIQRTPYGDFAYGELPDLIGKMKDMMQLENWKTMLDTVPVQEWPAYIEKKPISAKLIGFSIPKGNHISQISFYSMGHKMSRK